MCCPGRSWLTIATYEALLSSCTPWISAREHPTGAWQPLALHGILPASPGCAECAPSNTVASWARACLAHFLQCRGPLPGMPSWASFNLDCIFIFLYACRYKMGYVLGVLFFFPTDLNGDESYKTELGGRVILNVSTPGFWFWEKQWSQGIAFLSRNSSDKAFLTHLFSWGGSLGTNTLLHIFSIH